MTLVAWAGLFITFDRLDYRGAAPALTNAVYLGWTTPTALVLLGQAKLLPGRLVLLAERAWHAAGSYEVVRLSPSGSASRQR
jgi:hypothetical protein